MDFQTPVIPSGSLQGTWRVTQENLALGFQQSLGLCSLLTQLRLGIIWEAEGDPREKQRGPERVTEEMSVIKVFDIHA